MARISNDNTDNQINDRNNHDDMILPFQLQSSGLRGRSIRLGKEINTLINLHNYPAPIAHLLADMVTLAVALSSMLKFDGIFTLQASGKGIVKTLISDVNSQGHIRGCATFDEDALNQLKPSENGRYEGYTLNDLTNGGHLAFTVDQGAHTERYQGIVALEGESLQDSVAHYFEQSEQLRTSLYVASGIDKKTDEWRSGAMMIQFLPEDPENDKDTSVVTFNEKSESERKEDWHRSRTLLQTCTDDEILNKELPATDLLQRLFHEEGVVVFPEKFLKHQCRCSQERVEHVINSLSQDDKDHARGVDGKIEMTCEFCSQTYVI